jgi:hypothetical protein
MSITEIVTFVTDLSSEEVAERSIYVTQDFCRRHNLFIEDVFFDVKTTLADSDNYKGVLVILTLDQTRLAPLRKSIVEIINRHWKVEACDWDRVTKEVSKLTQ